MKKIFIVGVIFWVSSTCIASDHAESEYDRLKATYKSEVIPETGVTVFFQVYIRITTIVRKTILKHNMLQSC
jgi:hypothetical protein